MDYARTNPHVRLLLVGQALALAFFTLVIPIEVIYAKESLGTSSAGYAVLLTAWGAGILGGSLLYVRVKHRSGFVARGHLLDRDRRRLPRPGGRRLVHPGVRDLGRRRRSATASSGSRS